MLDSMRANVDSMSRMLRLETGNQRRESAPRRSLSGNRSVAGESDGTVSSNRCIMDASHSTESRCRDRSTRDHDSMSGERTMVSVIAPSKPVAATR
jgi:hypothetical protein